MNFWSVHFASGKSLKRCKQQRTRFLTFFWHQGCWFWRINFCILGGRHFSRNTVGNFNVAWNCMTPSKCFTTQHDHRMKIPITSFRSISHGWCSGLNRAICYGRLFASFFPKTVPASSCVPGSNLWTCKLCHGWWQTRPTFKHLKCKLTSIHLHGIHPLGVWHGDSLIKRSQSKSDTMLLN